jgi:hypothetical protein
MARAGFLLLLVLLSCLIKCGSSTDQQSTPTNLKP